MENFLQDIILYINELDTVLQYIGIFVISMVPFLESYVAIPVGIALDFPPVPIILIGIIGNVLSVIILIWIIDKFRKPNKEKKESNRWRRAQSFFQKYGVPGVSLAGPLIGYHIAALIALGAGTSKQYITLWQIIAISVWSIIFGVAFIFGIQLLIR
ncbi:small multi-drug export protein [Alkalihalobacillus trypoxylicola]|uniref:DNA-binding protein n=1 Tax=Alkalihalobacillus trypoxylicola TaxID=519424 RepID=A0A162DC77_9BACI|nr:small multi-drug export protein [Alkalihalobacillus trypoxylicola]KYG29154.1 hypothetical protein AZF04_20135 [Alkalihalobacillus trypoxylicola]